MPVHMLPNLPDFWMVYWNKALFAEKGLAFPKTMDEMLETARKLNDPARGVYGFVGRGQKNANVPLFTQILLWNGQGDTVGRRQDVAEPGYAGCDLGGRTGTRN